MHIQDLRRIRCMLDSITASTTVTSIVSSRFWSLQFLLHQLWIHATQRPATYPKLTSLSCHQNTQASSHHSYLYLQITLLTSNPRIHFAVVSVTYDSLKHSQPKINIFANSSLSSQSPLRFACYSLICSQFFSLMYTFMCLTGTKNPEDCNNLESSILEKTYIYAVNELTLSERIRHWLYKAYRYWVDCTQFIPSTWITPPSTFLKGALYKSLNEWINKWMKIEALRRMLFK